MTEAYRSHLGIATNAGPPGTEFVSMTNMSEMWRRFPNDGLMSDVTEWRVTFRYTNADATEVDNFRWSKGPHGENQRRVAVLMQTATGSGYNLAFCEPGGPGILFSQREHYINNGLTAHFTDDGHLTELSRRTNGYCIGKYARWDRRTGRLTVLAEFKEPYDWARHDDEVIELCEFLKNYVDN